MDSFCHPCFTTTNLSYRFPIFETSATALCGTTGILYIIYCTLYIIYYIYIVYTYIYVIYIFVIYIFVIYIYTTITVVYNWTNWETSPSHHQGARASCRNLGRAWDIQGDARYIQRWVPLVLDWRRITHPTVDRSNRNPHIPNLATYRPTCLSSEGFALVLKTTPT